ncbi:MAG: VOC family protein [Gammaproteobacteria bacterium]|nr:VOC family protein [Gammaproteobacteria bacterium]
MHKSRLGCIVIDCKTDDLDGDSEFWGKALGGEIFRRYEPGDENYRGLSAIDSNPRILLQKVSHESRVHLDIDTDDVDKEVERLRNLGAREIERFGSWCVMEAPSGHKFCVVKNKNLASEKKANRWDENQKHS